MAKPKNTPQENVNDETGAVAPVEETVVPVAAEVEAPAPLEPTNEVAVEPEAEHVVAEGDAVDTEKESPVETGNSAVSSDGDVAESEGDNESVFDQETETEAAPKDKRPVKYALVGIAVGLFVGFCFNFAVTGVQDLIRSSNATAITVAVSDCKLDGRDGISVSDNGKHLTIHTKGQKDESGATTQNAVCLIQALQVPQNVLAKLDSTKPDGQSHTESWDQREMTWAFSTDNGIKMDVLIKS